MMLGSDNILIEINEMQSEWNFVSGADLKFKSLNSRLIVLLLNNFLEFLKMGAILLSNCTVWYRRKGRPMSSWSCLSRGDLRNFLMKNRLDAERSPTVIVFFFYTLEH